MDIALEQNPRLAEDVAGTTSQRVARLKPIGSEHTKVFRIEARVLTARVHAPMWACLTWPLHVAVTMDLGEMQVFRSRVLLGKATPADFDAVCDTVRLVPCCRCGTVTFGAAGVVPVGDEVCVACGVGNAIDPGALQGRPPIDQKEYSKRLVARINANNRRQNGE